MENPCPGHAEPGGHRHVQPGRQGRRCDVRRPIGGGGPVRQRRQQGRRPRTVDYRRHRSHTDRSSAQTAAIPGTATTRMVRLKGRMGNKQCHDSPHPSAAFVPAYRYMTVRRLQPAGARRECEVIVRLLREAAQCRIQSSCSSLLWMRD
ncbi:hypothetical protein Blongum51A_0877 [Bifidobacterium longum]|nr:hypothetical protein Blongum51A_0877 [Bifidobacterium longum]